MDYLIEKNQLEETIMEMKKDIKVYVYKIDSLKNTIDSHNKSINQKK